MKGNCVACGTHGVMDRAHVRTRGSGADWHEFEWLLLCRGHHVRQGAIGWKKFAEIYPTVLDALTARGWKFELIQGIWKIRRGDS